MKTSMKSAKNLVTSIALTLVTVAAMPAFAGQYVGSYNCGIAKGWPLQNTLYVTQSTCQVSLILNRTVSSDFESRGTAVFTVIEGEGQHGSSFEGTYVRRGGNLYLDFLNRTYSGYRHAVLFEKQSGTLCVSATLSTSRRPAKLCEGPIGL